MKSDPQSPVGVVFWLTGQQHNAQWFPDWILQIWKGLSAAAILSFIATTAIAELVSTFFPPRQSCVVYHSAFTPLLCVDKVVLILL